MNNKNIKVTGLTAAGLIVGLLAGWFLFGGNQDHSRDDHENAETEIKGETVWTCSMHPQIRQNEEGDCPICGMDLIPLEEDTTTGGQDADAIRMSPTAMQLAGIETDVVKEGIPAKQVQVNGKVEADERLVYSQTSHIPGRIEDLPVNFTGEYVKKGQTIAYIYSPELITAQKELLEAEKPAQTQPLLFEAAKNKLRSWKIPDALIDEILKSGEIQESFPIQAQVSGYVLEKKVKAGDYILRGQSLFTIIDLSKVWLLFDVYESDLPWIKEGDRLTFTIAALPAESFEGEISFIDPVINPRTRVAKARIDISNTGGKLKPGMFATGFIEAQLSGNDRSLIVPKTAVMWTGKRSVVYIKTSTEQGIHFRMREITLGPALGDRYVIEEGLQYGEEIAVNGTFSIDAAAQLAGKSSMMSSGGGQAMTGHTHGESPAESPVSNMEMAKPAKSVISEPMTLDKQAKEGLQPLYTGYLQWKDALSRDDFEEAAKQAVNMRLALETVNMEHFQGEAHSVWMDYQSKLGKSLEHVRHFTNIEELRKAFQSVSETMIDMTITFKPLDRLIYVQHCPMADNNTGADWLSTNKEIRNPYFGSSMLTCGEVTKEIK